MLCGLVVRVVRRTGHAKASWIDERPRSDAEMMAPVPQNLAAERPSVPSVVIVPGWRCVLVQPNRSSSHEGVAPEGLDERR